MYELVEYIGTSGSTLTAADIAKFPTPPSSVSLTWVVAFVGDATSGSTPSGNFVCTGGSFCSGNNLNQALITALKGVSHAQVSASMSLLSGFLCLLQFGWTCNLHLLITSLLECCGVHQVLAM